MLNKYFSETATRLFSRKSMNKKELTNLIGGFQLQPVIYDNIEKSIKMT